MEITTQDGLTIVSSDQPEAAPPDPEQAAPEAAPEAPAESAPAPETPEPDDDRPLSGKQFQRYVDRQTRATRELERKLAERDGQIDLLMRLARGETPQQQPQEPQGPPRRPRQSEFATWEEYEEADNAFIRDMVAYERQQDTARERQQHSQAQMQQLEQDRMRAIADREQEVRRQHPDYDDRLQSLLPTITQGVLDALKMSGADGPDLVLHLAANPEDVQRLNETPWHDLGRELGKLAAHAAPRRSTSQQRAPNRLPEPPQPVSGGGATATPTAYRDEMTQQQFEDWFARMYPPRPRRGRLL